MVKRYVTLEDIAHAAGMSRAQVSRAIRGDEGVKDSTRNHVIAIASKLGYHPNLAARSLVSAQSTTVGVVIGEPFNPFHIKLAQAIDHALAHAGLDAVLSLRALDDRSTLVEADRFINLRAIGAILIGTPRDPIAIHAMAKKLPCVYLGKSLDFKNVSTIDIDDESGVKSAIRYLIDLGHRNIAHLAGGSEISAKERTAAYMETMSASGLPTNVWYGEHDTVSGHKGVDIFMAEKPIPTAIFASNDVMAIGAINRLRGLGYRVPEDVSVIGFDDIPAASEDMFSLSTLRQDVQKLAHEAVTALQSMTLHRGRKITKLRLPVTLVIRDSVSGPPRMI